MDETVYDAAWRAYRAIGGPSRSAVRAAVDAALAARQPVEQPMRSDLDGYRAAAFMVRRGYDVECGICGEFCDEGAGPCQPVGQEPVAWMTRNALQRFSEHRAGNADAAASSYAYAMSDDDCFVPLYTTRPAHAVGLRHLVPPRWWSEQIGLDDLTTGQAWRSGFNACRDRVLLLIEQAETSSQEGGADAP